MSLEPIGDRILVLPDQDEDTSEAGLILVRNTDAVAMSGTIASVGPGGRCPECNHVLTTDIKVGDRVVFAPEDGSEVTYDGVTYLVLTEDQILGIVEDA